MIGTWSIFSSACQRATTTQKSTISTLTHLFDSRVPVGFRIVLIILKTTQNGDGSVSPDIWRRGEKGSIVSEPLCLSSIKSYKTRIRHEVHADHHGGHGRSAHRDDIR